MNYFTKEDEKKIWSYSYSVRMNHLHFNQYNNYID